MKNTAILALANGTVFKGTSIGAKGHRVGEVVFNTSMTGYQEILTDPSYAQQIITLTYPHIGNVGTNPLDSEANTTHATGLVVRDASITTSSWRAEQPLSDFLVHHRVVAIADIDTRKLTRMLRDNGAQNGCIMAGDIDVDKAIALAQGFGGLKNTDLAQQVSTQQPYEWLDGKEWELASNDYPKRSSTQFHVVAYDFGIKHNILRKLASRGCKITVVPAKTSAADVMALRPDGIFLSNGPGDPAPCQYAIDAAKTFIDNKTPLFGICLGMQILSLAVGAQTQKMKFGHHGANHPVKDTRDNRVYITSQNHGFAVDEKTLPETVNVTHRSLFDGSLQGIELTNSPAFGFQGHPEASPGPQDIDALFDHFIALMQAHHS
ncbi:glutamine-hydrolyzing carbamoyl-phosphate synthase small subunit [Ostreibacterium oceani]|uniref:Carbamoyl phosphate synthase small chain n=1 Tax=Ostreibacterium oceani TaxID=2654998 RepID=A0A6N7EU62_9GAMM|nr:glutamine-hydrolyzing carbamoyl-phosphate synthase small subunit [Ostreibacterium oceani]